LGNYIKLRGFRQKRINSTISESSFYSLVGKSHRTSLLSALNLLVCLSFTLYAFRRFCKWICIWFKMWGGGKCITNSFRWSYERGFSLFVCCVGIYSENYIFCQAIILVAELC